jgi:hypothetical protein
MNGFGYYVISQLFVLTFAFELSAFSFEPCAFEQPK